MSFRKICLFTRWQPEIISNSASVLRLIFVAIFNLADHSWLSFFFKMFIFCCYKDDVLACGFLTCTRRDFCQQSASLTKIWSECERTCVGGLPKRVVHLLSFEFSSSSDYKRKLLLLLHQPNKIFFAEFDKHVQFWNNFWASSRSITRHPHVQ